MGLCPVHRSEARELWSLLRQTRLEVTPGEEQPRDRERARTTNVGYYRGRGKSWDGILDRPEPHAARAASAASPSRGKSFSDRARATTEHRIGHGFDAPVWGEVQGQGQEGEPHQWRHLWPYLCPGAAAPACPSAEDLGLPKWWLDAQEPRPPIAREDAAGAGRRHVSPSEKTRRRRSDNPEARTGYLSQERGDRVDITTRQLTRDHEPPPVSFSIFRGTCLQEVLGGVIREEALIGAPDASDGKAPCA